jgi:hypothetical protein
MTLTPIQQTIGGLVILGAIGIAAFGIYQSGGHQQSAGQSLAADLLSQPGMNNVSSQCRQEITKALDTPLVNQMVAKGENKEQSKSSSPATC